ncbi:GNAT family N-acetyltransferase [uncultured Sphingomonas sp.]|uniref:GNAT family N-acetyltransferase n=1 Tax=uncultured Sphingomonas sp. TaxID=158754 RepID=UPI00260070A4|nr:GNAT family N-acetyltransferase [uncultured Sphingomonas sp.]
MIAIREGGLDDVRVQDLLRLHASGMLANSPAESCHFLDLSGLQTADVTFWSAWEGEDAIGMGALKLLDATHGEVKSMRTAPAHLGRGVGAAMLAHILSVARARGLARLSLETGTAPAFEPAIRLYTRYGFLPCPPFGDYREDPHSRFLTLAL